MHSRGLEPDYSTPCDCSINTSQLTDFRLELGFNGDKTSIIEEAKNTAISFRTFCVVCLGLGWLILKEVKTKAPYEQDTINIKLTIVYPISNTQATRPLGSVVPKRCYIKIPLPSSYPSAVKSQ